MTAAPRNRRDEPFEFDFRPRSPAAPLDRAIDQIWYARGTVPYARERIAPTGSTVVVVVLGSPLLVGVAGAGDPLLVEHSVVIGPHDRPISNEPTAETFAVGIVTTPVGAEAALGLRPATVRGRVVAGPDVWAQAEPLRIALSTVIAGGGSADDLLDVVETTIRSSMSLAIPRLERVERAVQLLELDPVRAIDDVAGELGVSTTQLSRDVGRIVGMSPRMLSRVLRVRRLLAGIDAEGPVAWARLAAELGWYDQSHLIRDFTRHTGVTPTAYLEAQRRDRPDHGHSAGFVPSEDRR